MAGQTAGRSGTPPLRWLSGADVVAAMPPLEERLRLAELTMTALARRLGVPAFALNSSLGADAEARGFYLRCKGEAEDAVRALGFPSLTLVRPSLIGGERDESRPLERLGILAATALRPLVPARYRVVPAERIAHCLLDAALAARPGVRVVESDAIG